MSKETLETLNTVVLIGMTDKRGTAWHYRRDLQGEPNHYPGGVPVADVRRRLFNWSPVEGEITATALTPDGVLLTRDETRKAIMRSDTGAILGIFKNGYRPHPYDEWLVNNVETILDADLVIGSAGLLRGGGVAWVQVELEDTLETQGVQYRPFLTAATSLDGSLSTSYQVGAQVVSCDNTLSAALASADAKVKIKHSSRSLGRITEVRQALRIVHAVADDFAREVGELTAMTVSDQEWETFLDKVTPFDPASKRSKALAERKREELARLYRHDLRAAPWAGTGWGVMAAMSTWQHHYAPTRGATRAERNAERVIEGKVDQLDQATLTTLQSVLAA